MRLALRQSGVAVDGDVMQNVAAPGTHRCLATIEGGDVPGCCVVAWTTDMAEMSCSSGVRRPSSGFDVYRSGSDTELVMSTFTHHGITPPLH